MNKQNYQLQMEQEIKSLQGKRAKLLLHSCCAPCSTHVLNVLSDNFDIELYYYNPNIFPEKEYEKRVEAQKRLLELMYFKNTVNFIEGKYEHELFLRSARGLEGCKEGEMRCVRCIGLRLLDAAKQARKLHCDYFCSTLSISPHKNSELINSIGMGIANDYDLKYLVNDFKKKDGYKNSISLSSFFDIYRQDYCGCEFSINEEK